MCNYLAVLQIPWDTVALLFDLVQVFLSLAFFPVVKRAFPLVVRKLVEAWCSSLFLQGGHCIRSRSKSGVLRQSVDKDLEVFDSQFRDHCIFVFLILVVWAKIQQKEKAIGFA